MERKIEKLMEKKDESVDIKEELSGLERHNNFLEARARLTMSAPGSYVRYKTYTGKLKGFPDSPVLTEVVDRFYGSFGRAAPSPCFEESCGEFDSIISGLDDSFTSRTCFVKNSRDRWRIESSPFSEKTSKIRHEVPGALNASPASNKKYEEFAKTI